MSVYLDTGVFIKAVLNDGPQSNSAIELLKKVSNNSLAAITSSLTWDEVVFTIFKTQGREKSLLVGKKLLTLSNLGIVSVNAKDVFLAQKIMESTDLRPRDAIHAAVALNNGCTQIASFDSDFDRVKHLKRLKL